MSETEAAVGTRVTAVDIETGESESRVIVDNYNLVCDGSAYLDSIQMHANGTYILVLKGVKPR